MPRFLRDARPWSVALCVTALALGWQALVVYGYFQGQWSALFVTGERFSQSPAVQSESTYVFKSSDGYDGQFYHAIAHDPLDRHGTDQFLDSPQIRYPRILLPALSYALGQWIGIDRAYRALELAFLYLGVFCAAAWAAHHGKSAWIGAVFVAIPGVFISLERQLVDLPLCALLAAALLSHSLQRGKLSWLALAAASLARDMGVVAIAGFSLASVQQKQFGRAARWLIAAIPGLLWTAYVFLRIPRKPTPLTLAVPLQPILAALTHFRSYPFGSGVALLLNILDLLALAGLLLSLALGLRAGIKGALPAVAFALALFSIAVSATSIVEYNDAYSFARQISPLLTVQLMQAVETGRPSLLSPLALMLPRSLAPIGSMTGRALLHLLH